MVGRKVYIVGVGMNKFERPGTNKLTDYPDMGVEAVKNALADARIDYKQIQHASAGYVYGDSACGQAVLYELGMTQIPIINVNNNCATGASALMIAKQLVEGGLYECTLALGFEKMDRGALSAKFTDRVNPVQKHVEQLIEKHGMARAPMTAQLFGQAALEHIRRFGSTPEHFAKVALKNHKHALNNPNAQTTGMVPTLQDILNSGKVYGEILTKMQCCPTTNGAAAAILASEDFVAKHKLQSQAIEILAMEMRSDGPDTFESDSNINLVGFGMSKAAADAAYKKAGLQPKDVQVIELHDCFSANELITYEALGLAEIGQGHKLIDSNDTTYGGKWVVNPSGGLIGKGHPLGATGIAQTTELCLQLRGEANKRQVAGAKIALQHNIGLGGVAMVAIYRHANPHLVTTSPPQAKL